MEYIVFTLIVLLLSIPVKILGKNHIYSKLNLILIILSTSLFSGIRDGVGADFYAYEYRFNQTFTLQEIGEKEEKLFYVLIHVIRMFTNNSTIFFIVTSVIINMFIILIIYKKSENFTLSLFIYISMGFYFTSFNIVRQFIAMAIMFYIINFSNKLKKINIIIGTIIAFGFHNTSIIMLLLLLFKKNINPRRYIIVFFVVGTLAYFMEPIIRNILITNKYEEYEDAVFFSYGTNIIYIIEYLGILIFYYIYNKKIVNEEDKFYLMIVSCGFVFIILGLKGVLYNRIAMGFNLYNVLLLPKVINNIDNIKEKKVIKFAFYILFFIKLILVLKSVQPYNTNINFLYNEI